MKQYRKRVMLVLCMAACLFSLSACSANRAVDEEETLDPQMEAYFSQGTEGLLETITGMDKAAAEQSEASLLKQKEAGLASGVTSWMNVMHETGAYSGIISSTTQAGEDETYIGTIVAQFENRNVEFKVYYAWDDRQQNFMPTSIAFSPEYTTGEKMEKAAMNTLMGMGTVFLVLIFISLLISCFKFINDFEKKMKEKEAAAAPVAPAPAVIPVAETQAEELIDDLELAAVITAAIAAASNSSTDGLVVRSIKRAPGAKWKRA